MEGIVDIRHQCSSNPQLIANFSIAGTPRDIAESNHKVFISGGPTTGSFFVIDVSWRTLSVK